jgi:DNA helicase II / ATP-dependent DNA helicase PcrA
MNWTEEQEAILEAWRTDDRNIIVNALAGTGKTTVTLGAMDIHPGRNLYIAFVKRMVDDVKRRMNNLDHAVQTVNSAGMRLLRQEIKDLNVFNAKYRIIARSLVKDLDDLNKEAKEEAAISLDMMVRMVRAYLLPPDDPRIRGLCEMYGIEPKPRLLERIRPALEMGIRQAKDGTVDFDDQIFMPYILEIEPDVTWDYVYVDEVQDMNPAKIDLAIRLAGPDGRMFLAGDENQAIFGFSFADTDSFQTAKEMTSAVEYTMTVSHRFGSEIAAQSKHIVPTLKGENPDPGEITFEKFFPRKHDPSAAAVARTNSICIDLALQMMNAGIPAQIRARGLGATIEKALGEISKMNGFSYEQVYSYITLYEQYEITKMEANGADPYRVSTIMSVCDALKRAVRVSKATTVSELMSDINLAFSSHHGILLTTCHSAKGGQWDTVYILDLESFRQDRGDMQEWEYKQMSNLEYVLLTRATNRLVYVGNPVLEPEETEEQLQNNSANDNVAALAAALEGAGIDPDDFADYLKRKKETSIIGKIKGLLK